MNRRNYNKIEEIYKRLTDAADSGTHTYLDDNELKKLLNPIQKSLMPHMSHSDSYAFCLPGKCEKIPFNDASDDILLIESFFYIYIEYDHIYQMWKLQAKTEKYFNEEQLYTSYKEFCGQKGIRPINMNKMFSILDKYRAFLKGSTIPEIDLIFFIPGWHISTAKGSNMVYVYYGKQLEYAIPTSDIENDSQPLKEKRFNMIFAADPLCTDFEYILFSASLFSLLKPLFREIIKNGNTQFALQILVESEDDNLKFDMHTFLDCAIDMWCNYLPWDKKHKERKFLKIKGDSFRTFYNASRIIAQWLHLNFPIAFSDYVNIEFDDNVEDFLEDTDNFSICRLKKNELLHINKAKCLPIFLSYFPPKRSYPKKDCLTIKWAIAKDYNLLSEWLRRMRDPTERERLTKRNEARLPPVHKSIIQFYIKLLMMLNEYIGTDQRAIKKLLNASYEQALVDLGASTRYADDDQQHKAFFLASLYSFSEISNKNTNAIDPWERQTLQSAIKYVRDFFGVKGETYICSERRMPLLPAREARLEDFANFLQQSLQEKSIHHRIVAREEKHTIFLYYKDYWDEFCSYCRENHISVCLEREKFNRIILNGYLISQPKVPKPNTHRVRYDFWPVIDGIRQEPLLRVLKTILNLAQ